MSIAINSLRTYIFRIATGISGVLIGVLIARFLGPAGKGYYSGIFLFYGTFTAVVGTLGPAITYQITRLKTSPKAVFLTASLYSSAVGLLAIFIFWVYTILRPGFQPGMVWVVVAVAPLTLIVTNLNGLFQGLNRIITLNWIGIAAGLLQLTLLCIGFLGFQINVQNAIAFWLIGQLTTFTAGLWVSREFWLTSLRNQISLPLLKSLLGFGGQISLGSLIGILNSRIDSFLVLAFLKNKQYGLYSVAVNAAELLWYASGAISVAICAHVGSTSRERAGQLTAKAIRHTLLINIPLAVLMWSISWIIPFVYGQRFASAMLPYRIMLPGILAYSIASIFSTYFTNQLGKPKFPLMISLISTLIDLGASLVLIPRLGLIGGALANTISYVISISLLTAIFCKKANISVLELFRISREDIADYQILWGNIRYFFSRKLR
jgi:O-antigen/teichoic acid export membrane protein